ncbi:YecR family lipoprotein [Massilia timonae]|uniref:YecR family lipoprotein n=1 Tax=Massilia timonae TaxID=47229 RepID=UPI0028D7A2E3|nr:YecR family lipoprotein [Massilia timonae]
MKVLTRLAALAAVFLTLQGCAVQKQLVATGGSRADGTVKMSYEFGMFEQPVINVQQGLQSAIQRCQSWGYTGAEAFGGQTKQCNGYGGGNCNSWLVTMEFQCTGGNKVAAH